MVIEKRNYILYLLAIINFTHIVDSMLIMPLGDIFIELFQISAKEYSWLVSSYAFAAFVSSIAGIFILDSLDRRKALLFLYFGFSVATLMTALATSFYTLILIRILTGFFGGMIGAIVLSIVSDLYLFKERGKAMGVIFAAFSLASAMGIPVGIYLATWSGWQVPFIVIGSLGLLAWTIIFFVFPTMTSHIDNTIIQKSTAGFKKIFNDNNQIKALFAAFILILAHFMIIPFISPYMIKNVGLTQEQISYQFFFGGLATVISSPYIGKLTDRIGVMKVFGTVMILSFIPTFLITNLTVVSIYFAIFCTTLFFVFGTGRMISSNTLITAAAPPENRGSFMSLKSATQQLAIGVSAFFSGQIMYIGEDQLYHNYDYVGYLSIVFGLISLYLISNIKIAHGN